MCPANTAETLPAFAWGKLPLFFRAGGRGRWGAAWARPLAGAVSALNLVFLVGLVANQGALTIEIGYGIPASIYLLLLVALAAAILALPTLPLTIALWRDRVWSVAARTHYSLVALAALVFTLFLWHWNLLGINE